MTSDDPLTFDQAIAWSLAKKRYEDPGVIEFDIDGAVTPSRGGFWVQARVWVPDHDIQELDEYTRASSVGKVRH